MSAPRLLRCFVWAALALSCASAFANNLNFLKDTPISYMKPPDRQALNRAAQQALESNKDGETTKWSNEGTGNPVHIDGTVTPRDTTSNGGDRCRQVTLVAVAKGQTQTWTPTACKSASGEWRIKRK
ncbi:RT0821/Lpp0805 family surface protein [Caballeronia sp. LZ016]|uniref:RT0821/Lpp0805 family surface protein n=1 Tax=Caballeronia sp. LZ016 TaxID=3038554 RepID=UPI00285DF53C|nr:RT0821/Lpp0805 family surface protein [Caballeronia sp. LZ016]MDR5740920.1 RT0821/Lpp0805 family surface protein [Caballeronia sp. LZ016]